MKTRLLIALSFISFSLSAGAQSQYIQAVDEYVPAPGQFVNTLPEATADDTPATMAQKCTELLAGGAGQLVTLGAWGGYITFHFDHPVANIEGEKDFAVWGNANLNGAEPAIVMVSQDTNGNYLPDDEWFELRGSEYDNPQTVHHYELTYTYAPMADIPWTDNQGATGTVPRNGFHKQEYFPLWLAAGETLTFRGALLPSNVSMQGANYLLAAYGYGYADNTPNGDADACAMDIGWAVDDNGQPVHLGYIDFVRCYTAMNQVCGWIGETSSEITGAEDLHLEASLQQAAQVGCVVALPQQKSPRDLAGRRINAPARGIYILNGKKFIVK